MDYIELDRSFVEIKSNEEPNLAIGAVWGRRVDGWMSWDDLLKVPRAVLLGEAASGKTAEFQFRVQKLRGKGQHAFFLAIEELAEKSISDSLGPTDAVAFSQWKVSEDPASFFLDSLDEARLKLKSLESALKSFARGIGLERLDRVHVYVSCRVSDWRGEPDRRSIEQWIPHHKSPDTPATPLDNDARLLAPLFEKKEKAHHKIGEERKDSGATAAISVVQLLPLATDQMRMLASHFSVPNVQDFVTAIQQHGLEGFSQRPGDLVTLISYWKANRRFASLLEMTEYGISVALRERDSYRADSGVLTPERARIGAERLAAALTLSKSWTIRTIDPASGDLTLASDALDPASILLDWSDQQRAALLRRSIFAPASYGCIRFHHRSTQEFLTASWLARVRENGAPISIILKILFADSYGTRTAVSTLRPVAGWLALWMKEVRNQLADCEPFVLLVNGDPKSLPVEVRSSLLALLAKKHIDGEVSNDHVDSRALWMFADPKLASALRAAWKINDRAEFRQSLLRMIREGAIVGCADLARNVALDRRQPDYLRDIALEAMESCGDNEGMRESARRLLADAAKESYRFTTAAVEALFPRYLSVSGVLQVMTTCKPARPGSFDGFASRLKALWESCPVAAREEFAEGIGRLCLSEPHMDAYHPIAKAHVDLARSVGSVVRSYLDHVGDKPTNGLVQLLRVAERVDQLSSGDSLGLYDELATLVHQYQATNRALFWSDVSEAITTATLQGKTLPTTFRVIWLPTPSLWRLGEADLQWLYLDIQDRPLAEQRIALSAIVEILYGVGALENEASALRRRLSGRAVLLEDLESSLAETRKPPLVDKKLEARLLARAASEQRQTEKAKASWIDFKQKTISAPQKLHDSAELTNWSGIERLINLTTWLEHKTGKHLSEAAPDWRLLEEGFSKEVAVAYRDGMYLLWRSVEPVAPLHTNGNEVTIDLRTQYAFAGLAMESSEVPDWTSKLDRESARRAAQLSCIAEEGFPIWVDALVAAWPDETIPPLIEQLGREWKSSHPGGNAFLYWYAHKGMPSKIAGALFGILTVSQPATQGTADLGIKILQQMALDPAQRQLLLRNARAQITNLKAANLPIEPFLEGILHSFGGHQIGL